MTVTDQFPARVRVVILHSDAIQEAANADAGGMAVPEDSHMGGRPLGLPGRGCQAA